MTDPTRNPDSEPIAATQQFQRFVDEQPGPVVNQARNSTKMLLVSGVAIVIIAVIIVLLVVL